MADAPVTSAPTTGRPTEGWGWPERAAKAHYFVDDRSLCGRWWYRGPLDDPQGGLSSSDCGPCAKHLARRDRP